MNDDEYKLFCEIVPDHNSISFLQFLARHNKVVFENNEWLIIENIKYHTEKRPWHTAFLKGIKTNNVPTMKLFKQMYSDWNWLKKESTKQTIKRFHIHLYK